MPRPKPTILLSRLGEISGTDIISATSLYAVLYKNEPINIKNRYYSICGPVNKYVRSTFTTPRPAENLAKKLNREFDTTDFTTKQIL